MSEISANVVMICYMQNTESDPLLIEHVTLPKAGWTEPLDPALFHHPMLELFQFPQFVEPSPARAKKLFLVPTPNLYPGEEPDTEFAPKPTPVSELPEVRTWAERFVIGVLEIWSGRRQPMQLARWCHRSVFAQLSRSSGSMQTQPRVRKIYLSEPIEGVAETTVTLRIGDRVRSLILRFEGVDHRWLCTELVLL